MAKRKVRGDMTYLHEKLGQAMTGGLFTSDPAHLSECFSVLDRGLKNDRSAWYFSDPEATRWANTIESLIATNGEGSWNDRARRMTPEERSSLADAIVCLYFYLSKAEGEVDV